MLKMQTPRKAPSMARGLSEDELLRVIEAAGTAGSGLIAARNVALLAVFADSGLRVGEMAALTMDDWHSTIDTVGGKQKVVGTLRIRDSKSRRARTVGIGSHAVWLLKQYLLKRKGQTQALWADRDGKQLGSGQMQTIVRACMVEAGIKGKKGPHTLRHTRAMLWAKAGGDTETLRRILGHSSLNTTQLYVTGLSDEDVAKRQYSASPLDRMGGK